MITNIVNLTKRFVSLRTTQSNYAAFREILAIIKQELGGLTIEEFEKEKVRSLLVYNLYKRPGRFQVILNGHLDVVPGKKEQFVPYEKNGRLYGRGTLDMKGGAAVMILLFKEVSRKIDYPLGLQLVTDEEFGGFCGTKYQIEKGVRADFVIAGEPTNYKIGNKAKGIIWLKISSKGKSAHGAYPWEGENAVWKMKQFLDKLERLFPVPNKKLWKTTVNLSQIKTSNKTFNKVPDNCTIALDIRYIPEDKEKILKKIKSLAPVDFSCKVVIDEPSHFTDASSFYIKKLRQTIKRLVCYRSGNLLSCHGASDLRHFSQVGCNGVEFGPIGQGLHTDNEWVDIKSLQEYYSILKTFLLKDCLEAAF